MQNFLAATYLKCGRTSPLIIWNGSVVFQRSEMNCLITIYFLELQIQVETSGLARFRKAVSAWKDKVKIRNKFEIMVAISWSRYHVLLLQNSFLLKSQVSKLYVEDEVIRTQFYLVQKYLIKLCFSSILRPRLWTRINIGRNAF